MATAPYDPTAMARFYESQNAAQAAARAARVAATPRQMELNYRYGFYAAEQYDAFTVDWEGRKIPTVEQRDGIARQANVPPGFYDQGMMDHVPLRHRRPDVQHHFVRQVVKKFSAYLFGQRMRPKLVVSGDDAATEYLANMAKACSLWQRFLVGRNLAGAMGSVGMTFKFVNGRLIIELHDPRNCVPQIIDAATGDCSSINIQYIYEGEVTDPFTQKTKRAWLWYRRTIDTQADTVYLPALADPDKEPVWQIDTTKTVQHALGFFPGVWFKNTEIAGEIDGDPDCKGIYSNTEMMDGLRSQAAHGARNNADPTLHVATADQTLDQLRKGSKDAIRTEVGGAADYVEMSGSGVESALKVADAIERISGDAVGYVRDQEREGGTATAEEIRRRQGAEFIGTEERREHIAMTWIIPMAERIVRATRELAQRTVTDPVTNVVTQTTLDHPLPESVKSGELASKELDHAKMTIEVEWPPLVDPTAADAQAAAGAAATAKTAGIIDSKTATEFVAEPFGIKDVDEVVRRVREEQAIKASALESDLLRGATATPTAEQTQAAPAPAPAPTDVPPAETVPPVPALPGEPQELPTAVAPAAPAAPKEADQALNGAQVASLAQLAKDVYGGFMPREAALAIAMIAFPAASEQLLAIAIPAPKPPEAPAPQAIPEAPEAGAAGAAPEAPSATDPPFDGGHP